MARNAGTMGHESHVESVHDAESVSAIEAIEAELDSTEELIDRYFIGESPSTRLDDIKHGVELLYHRATSLYRLWRINKLDEAIKKHLYTKYEYQDQDIINILCRDKIKYLSPVYNFNSNKYCTFMSGKESPTDRYNVNMEELIKNIHIIHYCGLKPWNTMSQFLSGDWYAYYALSVFYSPGKEYKKYYDIIFPSWYDVIKLFYRRIKKAIQK